MKYISSRCTYCDTGKKIVADKTSWLIHLAKHREEIIEHLTESSDSCEFCSYPEIASNKKHASSHYRWSHQKSTLIRWALDKLPREILT